ncbi:MAG: TetR-like C-terminal domain-containing protein [Pseudomonadota bacterium]
MIEGLSKKKQDLLTRVIDVAEAEVAAHGAAGLKARDLAGKAGIALGTIYTVVSDMDDVITHVNSRTLRRLGAALRDAVPPDGDAVQVMHALAGGYVTFALANLNVWTAIFTQSLPEGKSYPDWHKADYPPLIEQIIAPLSDLRPDLTDTALTLRAKTLFASVHGVVSMSVFGRFVGVPVQDLHAEVEALVDAMTRGLEGVKR